MPPSRDEEVQRLIDMGTTTVADLRGKYGPGTGRVVIADPEGNEFLRVTRADRARHCALRLSQRLSNPQEWLDDDVIPQPRACFHWCMRTSSLDALPKIGAPATRALHGAGYTTLRQLAGVPRSQLAKLHGVGPKALGILQDALERHNLSLG